MDLVDDVEFAATPLDGRDVRRWRFLRSLEEGNVKPGELPPPNPEKLSDPAQQDLLLRAYRLNLIHGSAPFLGLQRSRAIPEAYQLVPLLMALNLGQRVRLLIGDDVGVGKSVEAGLITSELIARGEAERCLIVVPAGLREQWQENLSRFFHLDSVIMAGHTRPALERQLLPGQSPWDAFPIVVVSVDYLKRRIGEICSHRWDVVLFDEAHIAARPHIWGGTSQQDKERWELLQALGTSERVRHLLLLTATPHNGFTDCFTSLLEILNAHAVKNGEVVREVAKKHVVQRRRRDIREWYGHEAPLPEREQPDIPPILLSRPEAALMAGLRAYVKTLARIEGSTVGQWVSLHLQRRALSSPGAIASSLNKRIRIARKRRGAHLGSEGESVTAEAEAIVLDMDSTSDLEDEERWGRLDAAAVIGTTEELTELLSLQDLAKKIKPNSDRKYSYLVECLPAILKRHPKAPRALVFTRYKDTLSYLVGLLEKEARKDGALKGLRVFFIHGDMSQKDRRTVYKEFESTEKAVCIATDCISEGLDLQRGCAELIHYELPWNPNRLEQRNGRIDRYGQPEAKVYIHTLVRDDALDATILEVLVRKAKRIRQDHGFCPPIFSTTSELKRFIRRYGPSQLELPFDEETGGDDDLDALTEQRVRKIVEESFYGQEEVRLPEVQTALTATYQAVGHPSEIEGFVRSALNLVGARFEDQPDGTLKIDLTRGDLRDLGETIQATFKPEIARDDPNLELLDVAHPLMRRLIETVLRSAAGRDMGRVGLRGSRDVKEVTAVVHILARYVTQSTQPVLMEELIPIAYLPYSGKLSDADPLTLLRGRAAPTAYTPAEITDLAKDALQAPALPGFTKVAVEDRRNALEKRQRNIASVAAEWATGMDALIVASVDTLTLTLVVPAHG